MLRSSYGTGGGRVPLETGTSITLNRAELARLMDSLPTAQSREMHLAVRRGDMTTAQRIVREAAASYTTQEG